MKQKVSLGEALLPLHGAFRAARKNQGLSQRTFGSRTGWSQARTSEMELQRKSYSLLMSSYAWWAKALGVEFGVYYVIDGHFETINLTEAVTAPPPSASAADHSPESPSEPTE